MGPRTVPTIKTTLRDMVVGDWAAAARRCGDFPTAAEVVSYLDREFGRAS
jgi:hypothetical protein